MDTRPRTTAAVLAVFVGLAALSAGPARAGPTGADGPGGCTGSSRGRLLSTTALVRLSGPEVAAELRDVGLPDGTRYGVETYRLVYCTISPAGRATIASGLLVLPQARRGALPLMVYDHSSAARKTDAPSFLREMDSRLIPFFFASDGWAAVAPDYLGLGISPGRHPYVHADSEASATVDLLPAADVASRRRGVRLSHQVFVTGHSQGGHAAMAASQALQEGHGSWRLAALAPMSGPYDLSGAEPAAILDPARTDPQHASFYLAYIFTAWKTLYHLYADPHEVFTERYADLVEGLFDGTHGVLDIDDALPAPEELFRPETLALIAHPTGRYAAALRDNDVCHWAPSVPTRLYHSRGDRDVDFANAEQCRHQITARGGTAELVDLGAVDHIGTAVMSVPLIRTWFSGLAAA